MTVVDGWVDIGQLDFDFDIDFSPAPDPDIPADPEMLGSLEEAQEIYEAVGQAWFRGEGEVPPGWSFIGSGGTRRVYLSPSGVAYKVCHHYEDDDQSNNELEYKNFRRIQREGKLPGNWRIPRSYLHKFRGNVSRYNHKTHKEETVPTDITILALDYIDGEGIGGHITPPPEKQQATDEAGVVFSKIGLNDLGGKNVIKSGDTYYIIDAAERMLPPFVTIEVENVNPEVIDLLTGA
jgi:hypothetical protein